MVSRRSALLPRLRAPSVRGGLFETPTLGYTCILFLFWLRLASPYPHVEYIYGHYTPWWTSQMAAAEGDERSRPSTAAACLPVPSMVIVEVGLTLVRTRLPLEGMPAQKTIEKVPMHLRYDLPKSRPPALA